MDILSVGELSKTVLVGVLPRNIVVQILKSKPLKGNPQKQRLLLWDGENSYRDTVLNLDGNLPLPSDFSVVRIGDMAGESSCTLKRMPTEEDRWALNLNHFMMVKEGKMINRQLTNDRTDVSAGQAAAVWGQQSPSVTQTRTPPTATPAPTFRPPPSKTGTSSQPTGDRQQVKRNLMDQEEFGQPPAKRSAGEQEGTHMVEQLNPYINKFTLKVLVEQKSTPRQIHTARFQGTVLDCILCDKSGQIKVIAWNEEANKMDSSLEAGSTYLISGARVGPVKNEKFNTTGHNYELTWTGLTHAIGPITSAPVLPKFNFKPIESLADMASDTVVDVLGWAKEAGPLEEFRSKAEKDLKKRIVVLADNSGGGSSIELTLWAVQAATFTDTDKVLAVKGAKLTEFQGKRGLNLGFSGSVLVQPAIPGVAELEDWAAGLKGAGLPSSLLGSKGGQGGDFVTIQQIKEELAENRGQRKFNIVATPIKVNTDRMFYRAHNPSDGRSCRKGVQEKGPGIFSCSKCGDHKVPERETLLRYLVSLCLADCTSYEWANMFDAQSLFGMTAPELDDLRNSSETRFLEVVDRVQFSQMVFSVGARVETFNDQPKLKLSVEEVTSIDWEDGAVGGKRHIARMWSEVKRMENEMKVSHEEEYAIDVQDIISFI